MFTTDVYWTSSVDATPDGTSFPGFGHMHSLPRLKKWYNEFTSSGPLTDNEIAAGGAWQRRCVNLCGTLFFSTTVCVVFVPGFLIAIFIIPLVTFF